MSRPNADACVVDTHTWIWSVTGEAQRIGRRARTTLATATTAYVPAITQWETAQLFASKRIVSDRPITDWLEQAGATLPFQFQPLTAAIAAVSVELALEGFHADPADRMIYATARVLDIPLLTGDTAIRTFELGLPKRARRLVIWD